MTTIVFDGYTLAADKQVSWFNTKAKVTKIWKTEVGLMAGAGKMQTVNLIKSWLCSPDNPEHPLHDPNATNEPYPDIHEDDNSEILVISRINCPFDDSYEVRIQIYNRFYPPYDIEDTQIAIGSGADFAMGALACGRSASQAVEIASRFDTATGMGIDVLQLTEDK